MMSGTDKHEYSVKEQLRIFAENCSLHGVRIVGDPQAWTPRRMIWGMAVAAFFALVIRQGVGLLQNVMDPDIQTSISIDDGEFPIKLPAITICNKNNYRKSVDEHYRAQYKNGTLDITEYYVKSAHQLENMVMACGVSRVFNRECLQNFTQVLTDKGVCYTFNLEFNDPISSPDTGAWNAWSFLLNAEQYEYTSTYNSFGGAGFKILVHQQEQFPNVENSGFSIPPGEDTFISLSRSRVVKDVRMNCYNTKDPAFVNPLAYHEFYTRGNCYVDCFRKFLDNDCGCKLYYHKSPAPICEDEEALDCLKNVSGRFRLEGRKTCHCPAECDAMTYELKLSHSQYPAYHVLHHLQTVFKMPIYMQRDNIAMLVVYFETPEVVVTTQQYGYDVAKFGGDLGGYMGLMLGASFLTLMEVFDLIGRLLHLVLSRMTPKTTPVTHFVHKQPAIS